MLREALPDVFDTLLAVGAFDQEVWRKAPPGTAVEDHDIVYLRVRREVIEWALRNAVLAESDIIVRPHTHVTGLFGDEGPVPHVGGVTTSEGEQITGDLVVDALGRRSLVPSWLPLLGGTAPNIDSSECGFIQYSRYFQLRPGRDFPEGPWVTHPQGDLGYARFAAFFEDNGTLGITLQVPTWDRELRGLRREEAYMAACRAIPMLQSLVDPEIADPITPVLPMGSLQNSLRNYAPNGQPVALGIIPVGDAYGHTDPTFALGLSMSLVHVAALERALAAHPSEPAAMAIDYFAATLPEAAERYAMVTAANNDRARLWQGEKFDLASRSSSYPLFVILTAAAVATRDPEVFRKVLRRAGLLDRTAEFDDDIELQELVERIFAEMAAEGPRPQIGPTRDALLALIGAGLTH